MKAKIYFSTIVIGLIVATGMVSLKLIGPLAFSATGAALTVLLYLPMTYIPVGRKLGLFR